MISSSWPTAQMIRSLAMLTPAEAKAHDWANGCAAISRVFMNATGLNAVPSVTVVYMTPEAKRHTVEIPGYDSTDSASALLNSIADTLRHNGVLFYQIAAPGKINSSVTEEYLFTFAHVKEFRVTHDALVVTSDDMYTIDFGISNHRDFALVVEMITKYGAYLKAHKYK